jgi:adenosylcobinamide-phosphate synthase
MTAHITIAYLLDLILGDPRWLPHPVVLMGRGITAMERCLWRAGGTARRQRLAGMVLTVILVGGTWILAEGLLRLTQHAGWIWGAIASVFLAYTTLATRSLHREAEAVIVRLAKQDRVGARERLAGLVSRETQHLDDDEICRALIETVAENTSDGIVAPLFYLGLGGPALALVYKATSTLDSMIGYRNERYLHFGWAAARLDDAANLIPARITALLMVGIAFVLGKDWRGALRTVRREAGHHESPNAGFPEAAVAGALRIRLGGPSTHFGKTHEKPHLGEAHEPLSVAKARESVQIMIGVSVAMATGVVLTRAVLSLLL